MEYCQAAQHFKLCAVVPAFGNLYASQLPFTVVSNCFVSKIFQSIPLYFLLNKAFLFKTLINTLLLNNKTPLYHKVIQCFIL